MKCEVIDCPKIAPADPFDFAADYGYTATELVEALADEMLAKQGFWLSAPMCGINLRVAVIASNPVLAMVNPRVVNFSQNLALMEEGGLSWTGLVVKVKRPDVIRLRYTQPNEETLTKQLSGLTARLVQQCVDSLDGHGPLYRANRYHRDQASKRWSKFNRDATVVARDIVADAYRRGAVEIARRQSEQRLGK